MRLLQIRLLFNGLFDYFSQFQAVDFITERSSCNERRRVRLFPLSPGYQSFYTLNFNKGSGGW